MNKQNQIYLLTFFAIGLIVFFLGFIGTQISLQFIQSKYEQLQLDVNKRNAEQMAFFLESELKKGIARDTVASRFQNAISGTQSDQGFLCIYDAGKENLICHPDKKIIGLRFDKNFNFKTSSAANSKPISEIYKEGKPFGGLFYIAGFRTDIVYSVPIKGTSWFLNAHENDEAIASEIKNIKEKYITGSLIIGFILAISATITTRNISRKYEKEIEGKNTELDKNLAEMGALNLQVQNQNRRIMEQNTKIMDSINYAERIQRAVIPTQKSISDCFEKSFVLFRPKDVVSGDFYWIASVNNFKIIVAGDCVGHGVPGALLSMFGIASLHDIIHSRQVLGADLILNQLRERIIQSFQSESGDDQKEGMDVSVCVINTETKQLDFSSANHSVYLFRNNSGGSEGPEILRTDKMHVGSGPNQHSPFSNQLITLEEKDRIYMFSDGYPSQFGGEKGEKLKSVGFRKLIQDIQPYEMAQQKNQIENALSSWQGSHPQIDDILVIGFEI